MNELQQATPSPLFPGMWPQAASALTREAHSLEPCLDDSDGCQDKALCMQKAPSRSLLRMSAEKSCSQTARAQGEPQIQPLVPSSLES